MTADQLRDIGREITIDPRVLAIDATDAAQLVSSKMTSVHDTGYDFDTIEEENEEVDVDAI
jgi:hypothetical protein